ncbi:MAG: hypothetical protein V1492_01395 [Candidatus Micrarchaeota archaeon]
MIATKRLVFFFALFLLVATAAAHLPRIVMGADATLAAPIVIDQPEVSKAYYGELAGTPQFYTITSDKPFTLYAGLLTPAASNNTFSVIASDAKNMTLLQLNGSNSSWSYFYEEFGGDGYRKGPEGRVLLGPGTYRIQVSNADYRGKYVLAVGEQEVFPLLELPGNYWSLLVLKQEFFGKPVALLFLQLLGIALVLGAMNVSEFWSLFISGAERYAIAVRYARSSSLWLGTLFVAVTWAFFLMQNPVNLLGILKTVLLMLLIINATLFYLTLSPKVDKSGRNKAIPDKDLHTGLMVRIALSVLGWWSVLLLTAAIL